MIGKGRRGYLLARFVGRKGVLPGEVMAALGEEVPFREVKRCYKDGATVSVYELFSEEPEGFFKFKRLKRRARLYIYWFKGGEALRENLRHVHDVIFEISSVRRAYVVRSANYEGVRVSDLVWKWLVKGYDGKLVYLKIEVPSKRTRRKVEELARKCGFVFNGCSGRLEGPSRAAVKLKSWAKVWADEVEVCDFSGKCSPLEEYGMTTQHLAEG